MKLEQEYEIVAVDDLKEHPQNPRRGDVEVIGESMDANGWYGVVVAQRSTGFILAGNHRYRVAKSKGAERVPVIWKEVDDQTALRILLADNKTADAGEYDEETLTELLSGLETLEGTGYGLAALEGAEESLEGENGAGEGSEDPVPEDVYEPSYGVMVVCEDEAHQERVFAALSDDYELRVVAV